MLNFPILSRPTTSASLLFCFFSGLLLSASAVQAQSADSLQAKKKNSFIALPAVFRYPETRFGAVVAAIYTYDLSGDTLSRPSQLLLGGGYTQNRQVLSYLNSRIITKGRKYIINSEFGYYDYFFPYGGIGFAKDKLYNENYTVAFPRIRINSYRRFGDFHYLGLMFYYDRFSMKTFNPEGELISGRILGSAGGDYLQTGLNYQYDSRDNIFSAQSGYFVDAVLTGARPKWIGAYSFLRMNAMASTYRKLGKSSVLAAQVGTDNYLGEVPFNAMATLGGARILRGFYDGRYRNNHSAFAQAEYRWYPLNWLGFTGFAGTGSVAPSLNAYRIDQWLVTAGAGVRLLLNKKDRIYLRIDYGQTNQGYGNFYLTLNEAF